MGELARAKSSFLIDLRKPVGSLWMGSIIIPKVRPKSKSSELISSTSDFDKWVPPCHDSCL